MGREGLVVVQRRRGGGSCCCFFFLFGVMVRSYRSSNQTIRHKQFLFPQQHQRSRKMSSDFNRLDHFLSSFSSFPTTQNILLPLPRRNQPPPPLSIPPTHPLLGILLRKPHRTIKRPRPIQMRRIIMRMTNHNPPQPAPRRDEIHRGLIEIGNTIPQNISL